MITPPEGEKDPKENDELVICDMNVEGMPWYVPPHKRIAPAPLQTPLSWKENLKIMLQIWKASFAAWVIFSLGMIGLILLLIALWS